MESFSFTTLSIPRTLERREKAQIPIGFSFEPYVHEANFPKIQSSPNLCCSNCGAYYVPSISQNYQNKLCPFCNLPSPFFSDIPISYDISIDNNPEIPINSPNSFLPRTIFLIDCNFEPKIETTLPIILDVLYKLNAKNVAIGLLSKHLTFYLPNGHLVTLPDLDQEDHQHKNNNHLQCPFSDSIFHQTLPKPEQMTSFFSFISSQKQFSPPDLITSLNLLSGLIGKHGRVIFFLSGMPRGIYSFDRYKIYSENNTLQGPNFQESDMMHQILSKYQSLEAIIEGFVSGGPNRLIDVSSLAKICEPLGGRIVYINKTQFWNISKRIQTFLSEPITINQIRISCPTHIKILPSLGISSFDSSRFISIGRCLFFPLKILQTLTKPISFQSESEIIYLNGMRIRRICNTSVSITDDLSLAFKSSSEKTLLKYNSQILLNLFLNESIPYSKLRDRLLAIIKPIYYSYRLNVSLNPSRFESLIMTSNLEFLPLYSFGILKSSAFTSGGNLDERAFQLYRINEMSPDELIIVGYPILFDMTNPSSNLIQDPNSQYNNNLQNNTNIQNDNTNIQNNINIQNTDLSNDYNIQNQQNLPNNVQSRIVYQNLAQKRNVLYKGYDRLALSKHQIPLGHITILFDGFGTWIHLDRHFPKELCQKFFGVATTYLIKSGEDVYQINTPESQRLFDVIKGNLRVVVELDEPTTLFNERLVEDSTISQISYDAFMSQLKQLSSPRLL